MKVSLKSPERIDPHRKKFVKEMRKLFLDSGFDKKEVVEQGPTERGPDIILQTKENKTILVQCRWAKKPGKMYRKLDRLISEYRGLIEQFKADAALLALKGYEIPPSFREKESIDKFRQEDRVVYWDDDVITYYKRIVSSIGAPHSRYILLKDLGFKFRIQEEPYKVTAVKVRQRDTVLYVFAMAPEKLLKLAYVSRRDMRDPTAYQRLVGLLRLKSLGKFVSLPVHGESGLLANNVILAFEEKGVKFTGRTLAIPPIYCSAWVIDGQHRLYGFCKLDKKLSREEKQEILEGFPLICTGIKDVRKTRQAKLFREINEFQKRINRNLLLDLFHHLEIDDGRGLLERIDIVKRLRRRPVFKHKIKILRTDKGNLSLATFVDYKRMKELVATRHRKAQRILETYFETVHEVFPEEFWDKPKKYVLWTNKGVRMLLSLLHMIIKYDGATKKNFRKCLTALKDSASVEADYFLVENYKGKALGAGAPDIVALEQWAKKIQEKILDFPVESEVNPKAYPVLQKLEGELRTCVETELSKVSRKWWKQRIPGPIKTDSEERKAKNERLWPWLLERDLHPVHYLNFADYRTIITKKDNWRDAFKTIFKDHELTRSMLKELEPIRNATMHPRKLSRLELRTLQLNTEKLIACMTVHREKMTVVKIDTKQIPQANDLDKVVDTAIAVITRKKSLLSGRQRLYHRTAAEILGFITRMNENYRPTDLGKKFAETSPTKREKMLVKAVAAAPIFQRFLLYSEEHNKRKWPIDEIWIFLLSHTGLSEATARRRAQVIRSWLVRVGLASLEDDSLILV